MGKSRSHQEGYMRRFIRIAATVGALGLVAAACGDDKGGGTTSASSTTAAATGAAATGATASTGASATGGTGAGSGATGIAALGVDVKKDCPADYKPDQGISATEILVGQSVPKTGPSSAFSLLTTGMQAYFDYANTELNGVNGKKLKLVSLDDAYEPEKTVKNVNDLLSQGVFVTAGILGTPNNEAVREVLNDKCVPQLYPATGAVEWGDVENYPWTVSGAVVPYNVEAKIWADYLKKTFPNGANVVAIEMNNSFGAEYETWFKKYIEGSNIKLTKVEKHDPASADVTNQITTLAATKADAIIAMTTSSACTSAMKAVGASGWKPVQIISGTCKTSLFFVAAGDGAKEALIVSPAKEITYPEYDGDPAIKAWRDLLAKYAKDAPQTVSLVPTGWLYGEILRDTLLRAEKLPGGLTRPNVLVAARQTDFKSPYYYDGVKLKLDGKADPYMIESGRVEKWNGTAFQKVTDLYSYEGTTKLKP